MFTTKNVEFIDEQAVSSSDNSELNLLWLNKNNETLCKQYVTKIWSHNSQYFPDHNPFYLLQKKKKKMILSSQKPS